jgi:hypothetical protein
MTGVATLGALETANPRGGLGKNGSQQPYTFHRNSVCFEGQFW